MKNQRRSMLDRFWEKVLPEPNSGCWLWLGRLTGTGTSGGYGQLRVNGKHVLAHRLSYMIHKGKIPEGLDLDHLCRVRCCVNPAHLEPVTPRENIMRGERACGIRSGRYTKPEKTARGENHGNSRLCAERVIEIRKRAAAGESIASLSRELHFSEGALRHVVKRRSWRHI